MAIVFFIAVAPVVASERFAFLATFTVATFAALLVLAGRDGLCTCFCLFFGSLCSALCVLVPQGGDRSVLPLGREAALALIGVRAEMLQVLYNIQ